jgi:hypothetical protein
VQVRLADVGVAGVLEPPDGRRGPGRNVLGEQDRAVGRDEAGGVEQVLDGERNTLAGVLRPSEEDPFGRGQSRAR